MGIRFFCPKGHKLNVKDFQAGRKGICPYCGARIQIPTESTRPPSKKGRHRNAPTGDAAIDPPGGEAEDGPTGPVPPVGATTPSVAPEVGPPVPEAAVVGTTGGTMVGDSAQGPLGGSPIGQPAARPASQSSPAAGAPARLPAPTAFAPAAPVVAAPGGAASSLPSPVADPLAEAGDVVWYVRPSSGGQFGPASSEVMRTWLDQNRVGVDSLVWREGWPDWRQAATVFPQLRADQPAPVVRAIRPAESPVAGGATAARNRRGKSLRQAKKTQSLLVILLIFAVVALFGVFLWVVFG